MKLTAVMGSPHGMEGNTGLLLKALIDAAEENGAEVELFCLDKMDVGPCLGCGACHAGGECVIQDDFGRIKESLLESDGVVLASPNYIFSVSAQMKALIDRCSCPVHCQALDGRYGAAVSTSGGGGEDEVADYALRFLSAMGCWRVGRAGAVAWQLAEEGPREQALEDAARLGRELVEAIEQKKTYPAQEAERTTRQERFRSLVMLHGEDWPYELAWWEKQGQGE